jgi:hypothetical protein
MNFGERAMQLAQTDRAEKVVDDCEALFLADEAIPSAPRKTRAGVELAASLI